MPSRRILPLFAIVAQASACGSSGPPVEPAPLSSVVPATTPPLPSSRAMAARSFKNPGGMWMPEQLASHVNTLRALGLEVDPVALTQPTSELLGAVVSLGGCSASFVSDDGLIITNHHCAVGALQYNSTPNDNLLREGFLAKTRADERWNGPSARVLVTQSLRDVTREVTTGLDELKDDTARFKKVEARSKELVGACENGRPDHRCSVAEYFGGAEYRLIDQVEIKDVRLVFAPHDQIGDFGGETDNWHWPRHSGDVAMFRAYVGADGKPAEHASTNVPFKPLHHLRLASKPLTEGDLVIVAGYPGATNRLRTSAEAREAIDFYYPHRIAWCDENIALLDRLRLGSDDRKLKATPIWRGLNNVRTKMRGILDGLVTGGLAAQKAASDSDLVTWINADPSRRAAYGGVVDALTALVASRVPIREHDAELGEMNRLVTLYNAAATIVRMAEERPKPDAERDPAYQARNLRRLQEDQVTLQKRYDRVIDTALLKLAVQRALHLPEKQRPEFVGLLLGNGPTTDARIDEAIAAIYDKTGLEDEKTRVSLLDSATTAELKKSADPMIQLALALRPAHKAVEDREHAYAGAMLRLRPRFINALSKRAQSPLAPDANGTLRVTYGTVRGYRPTAQASVFRPFSTVSEILQKNTGRYPFDAPKYLLNAIRERRFGPYADATLGEVPVDFLSDLDITGGNSGSATINGRGEIVGLAFDGNYEAMASDWLFQPAITRTIHVDLRYVLWLLDTVLDGRALVHEMTGSPAATPEGKK